MQQRITTSQMLVRFMLQQATIVAYRYDAAELMAEDQARGQRLLHNVIYHVNQLEAMRMRHAEYTPELNALDGWFDRLFLVDD